MCSATSLAALAPGCYLSHGRPDAPPDAGVDAFVRDAGTDAGERDAGTDAGPIIVPDGAVTEPCQPDPTRVPPAPGGPRPPPCELAGAGDHDGDGFPNDEDCNDCSPQINPGAYDFPGNGVDEDCSGADAAPCDESALPLEPASADDAARALGLCQLTSDGSRGWGVLSARFTTADGAGAPAGARQVGLLRGLGRFPHLSAGGPMLALGTGIAREPEAAGETTCVDLGGTSAFPPGFPLESSACPGVWSGSPYDSVALEVRLRVPTNVRGFQLASSFFTHEYPDYICSPYNDVFAVFQDRGAGLENIVFDSAGNPVTVNNALLAACRRGTHGGRRFDCPLGYGPLVGTGYEVSCPEIGGPTRSGAGASTGCIRTVSTVSAGEVTTLRFAIWDSGDGQLDSLALVDGFEWIPQDFEIVPP